MLQAEGDTEKDEDVTRWEIVTPLLWKYDNGRKYQIRFQLSRIQIFPSIY